MPIFFHFLLFTFHFILYFCSVIAFIRMKRLLFPTLLCLLTMHISAQQPVLNKEHNTPKTVPAGNNSGITRSEDEEDKVKTPAFLSRNELPDPTRFIAEPPQPGTGPFENEHTTRLSGRAR